MPPGVKLPPGSIDASTAAAIIRIAGGNFRLLNRLLTQVERILEINALPGVTKEAVEAARESLVIGQAEPRFEPPSGVLTLRDNKMGRRKYLPTGLSAQSRNLPFVRQEPRPKSASLYACFYISIGIE